MKSSIYKTMGSLIISVLAALALISLSTPAAAATVPSDKAVSSEVSCHIFDSRDVTPVSERRAVSSFDEISNLTSFCVTYIKSDAREVVVEGDSELVSDIMTEVSGGNLRIFIRKGSRCDGSAHVTVYAPEVEQFNVTGSGDIACASPLTADDIEINVLGSGSFVCESISVEDLEASLKGSGSIRIASLGCVDAELSSYGSGVIEIDLIQVDQDLEMSTYGSGSIRCSGKALDVEAKVYGSGSIGGDLNYGSIKRATYGSGRIHF